MSKNIATLDNIKQLRTMLDAPYQDCVAALNANDNDIDKATAWLKENAKVDTRTAKVECGAIGWCPTGKYNGDSCVILVPVKCETDFVAINADFIKLIDILAEDMLTMGTTKATEKFKESAWTFKENIEVGTPYVQCYEGGNIVVYMHHNRTRASAVVYQGGSQEDANRIAVQVCAMSPQYLSREHMNPADLKALTDKFVAEAVATGKPENIAEKIAIGKLNSALKENVLLEQPLFDDAKMTVGQFAEKSGITVRNFVNMVVS